MTGVFSLYKIVFLFIIIKTDFSFEFFFARNIRHIFWSEYLCTIIWPAQFATQCVAFLIHHIKLTHALSPCENCQPKNHQFLSAKICYRRNFNVVVITDCKRTTVDNVFAVDSIITEKLSIFKKFFGYRSKKFGALWSFWGCG